MMVDLNIHQYTPETELQVIIAEYRQVTRQYQSELANRAARGPATLWQKEIMTLYLKNSTGVFVGAAIRSMWGNSLPILTAHIARPQEHPPV
jgi:hypothetical protein